MSEKTPPPSSDNSAQSKRFIEMAREVETDESADAFEQAFARVAHFETPESETASVTKRAKMLVSKKKLG